MQYNTKEHTVIISVGTHYTKLIIRYSDKILYEEEFLPVLGSRIAAERNAQRIAESQINHFHRLRQSMAEIKTREACK